jgi:hypothetical protein
VEGGAGEDRVRKDVLMRAWRTSTCSSLIDQLDYLRVRRDSIEIGAGKAHKKPEQNRECFRIVAGIACSRTLAQSLG